MPANHYELANGERVVTRATLARGETAVLTNRRLLVSGASFENAFALPHIALVRVSFRRSFRGIAIGVALLVAAGLLAALHGPARTLVVGQLAAVESTQRAERLDPETGSATPQLAASLLRSAKALISLLPLAALALGVVGLARVGFGALGQTVVQIHAGGAELAFAKRGRDPALEQFAQQVGRSLSGSLAEAGRSPPPPPAPPMA
ncbi:MAG: hypothetical protein WCA12_16540 [Burkholderiales bacterium]